MKILSIARWLAIIVTGCATLPTVSHAEERPTRSTIWDIHLGDTASSIPNEYVNYACGTNGGPPSLPLANFAAFKKCKPDANGLHEVYFEYDDELEYIARAKDIDREITRWAGTTEIRFPLIVSALFDDAGVLEGIRLITDSRPEHRSEITEADLKTREDAYQFGGIMAGRFNIEAERDCKALPPAEGENEVGTQFIKRACEKIDADAHRKYVLRVNLYRKPGQSAVNPQLPTQLTQGQFESSSRLEIYVSE